MSAALQQCPNPAVQGLFSNFNPVMCFKPELKLDQQELLELLSKSSFNRLSFRKDKDRDLALDLFSSITKDKFLSMDCPALNKIWRNTMTLVHPDKVSLQDKQISHRAAVNLNNARETLGCRYIR